MSAVFKAFGSIQQGKAQYETAQSQAYASEYNAQVAESNAKSVLEQSNAREESQRRNFRALQGEAIAAGASSGTTLEGSNTDVLRQNAVNNELDALTIRYEGQMANRGLMAQAAMARYNAAQLRRNGKSALEGGYINAAANILDGVSEAAKYAGG